jgi:Tfp pilus assembly protein PilF
VCPGFSVTSFITFQILSSIPQHSRECDRDQSAALEVAQREIGRRHDVFTLDSYAWALYKNGQYGEARKQIEIALAVGVHDAKIFRHAGEIALKSGDKAAAEHYLRESAELNSVGSEQARITLASLPQKVRR